MLNNVDIIEQISKEFNRLYNMFLGGNKTYLYICRENNHLLDKEIEFVYENKPITGKVIDINESCELVVQIKNDIINLKTGEVLLKKSYFY